MNLKAYTGLLTAALLVIFWNPVAAQQVDPTAQAVANVPELLSDADQAFAAKDYRAFRQAMEALHRQRPNNSEYMYRLVLAYALLDEKRPAFNLMLQMQRQGLSYDFDQAPESANLRGTQVYTYLNDLMVGAGQPIGAAEVVLTLDQAVELPEAIAWDASREQFLVGTVAHGQILAVGLDGRASELLRANEDNRVWGIYGLAVDAARNRLWASSAAHPAFSGYSPVDQGRSMLLEFRLDDMELIRRYPVPVDGRPHSLGKLAVAPNGDVYVADSLLPIVYTKKADSERLRPYFASAKLVSLRGLDLSDDGKLLYLADYEMGIVVIDIAAGKPFGLQAPDTLNLGGINGLGFWQGHLVIVQNGIRPQRLMSLELDETGKAVSNVAPLAVALDILDFPSNGTVVDDDFYFFANAHREITADELRPVTIARTSLQDVAPIINPEAQRLFEQYEQARERGDVRPMEPPPKEPGDSGTPPE
jgi:hypothetical protein